jgi:hypothetical protein
MSIELAMLFCHAGCDVFFALPDRSVDWVSPTAIKEITGHQPYYERQPGWCKSKHAFDLTLMLEPSIATLEKLLKNHELDEVLDFIKKKTRIFAVISSLAQDSLDYQQFLFSNFRFFQLPELISKPAKAFNQLFACAVRMLAGLKRLQHAKCNIISDATIENEMAQKHTTTFYNNLSQYGFTPSQNKDALLQIRLLNEDNYSIFQANNSFNEAENEPLTVNFFIGLPCDQSCPPITGNPNKIIAWPCNNNIYFADHYSQRLLPDVPGQSSIQRFCQYLADSCYYKLNENNNL